MDFGNTKKLPKQINSRFIWKNESSEIMWFHVSAELFTALSPIVAGIVTFYESSFSNTITFFVAGLFYYASLNSMSWVFAEKSRLKLIFPMMAGILTSIFALYFHLN